MLLGLVKVANSMPQAQVLRITRKGSRDTEGSASDMVLCTTTQVVPSPVHLALQENEVQEPNEDPFRGDLNDHVATPIGSNCFVDPGGLS